MNKVFNVRGCSGSGKTWVVNQVREAADHTQVYLVNNKVTGYRLEFKNRPALFVVGKYETACGGCDTIKTMAEVKAMVLEHSVGNTQVLYEGLLWSTVWKSSHELAEQLRSKQIEHVWLHLNTPLETCLAQIKQRWVARGKEGELSDTLKANALSKWNTNRKIYDQAAGMYPNLAHWVSSQEAANIILNGSL